MLSETQALAIKKQLLEHIEKTFPEDKKHLAKQEIEKMDAEGLEEFIVKNNLLPNQNKNQECIFCSIIFGDIPSYKIEDSQESIAILEINPISKGHSLVIPKKHLKEGTEIPKDAEKLAKRISRRIKSKLKPKRTDILFSSMFGHNVINILPIYNDETLASKRSPAKKEELEEVEKMLKAKPKAKKLEIKKPRVSRKKLETKENNKKLWLPQRIP